MRCQECDADTKQRWGVVGGQWVCPDCWVSEERPTRIQFVMEEPTRIRFVTEGKQLLRAKESGRRG